MVEQIEGDVLQMGRWLRGWRSLEEGERSGIKRIKMFKIQILTTPQWIYLLCTILYANKN